MSESTPKAPLSVQEATTLATQLEEEVLFSCQFLPYSRGFLERFATGFLRRRGMAPATATAEDPVYLLTPKERANLKVIIRRTVLRAMFAGLASASITASIDILLRGAPVQERYFYLIIFALIATVIEVSYLYWSHLSAMIALSQATGAQMLEDDGVLADSMGRAALELPDPTEVVEGINPHRETSELGLAIAVALYKLKRGLTSFIFKLAIRQTATREALKIAAPMIALPVSGIWNLLVSYRILREARMRVLGPSAAEEMIALVLDHVPPISRDGKVMLLRAVGVAMVRKRSAHPNLLALLRTVVKRTGAIHAKELDNTQSFLRLLPTLALPEQKLALIVLQIGIVLDGSISLRERNFVRKARGLCGLSPALLALDELLKTFAGGDPVYPGMLDALARD